MGQPTPACAILSRPRRLGQCPAPELPYSKTPHASPAVAVSYEEVGAVAVARVFGEMQGRSNLARNASFHARLSLALPNLGLAWRSARTSLALHPALWRPHGLRGSGSRQKSTRRLPALHFRQLVQLPSAAVRAGCGLECDALLHVHCLVPGSRCAHALLRGTRNLRHRPWPICTSLRRTRLVGVKRAAVAPKPSSRAFPRWYSPILAARSPAPSSGNTGRSPQEWAAAPAVLRFAFISTHASRAKSIPDVAGKFHLSSLVAQATGKRSPNVSGVLCRLWHAILALSAAPTLSAIVAAHPPILEISPSSIRPLASTDLSFLLHHLCRRIYSRDL